MIGPVLAFLLAGAALSPAAQAAVDAFSAKLEAVRAAQTKATTSAERIHQLAELDRTARSSVKVSDSVEDGEAAISAIWARIDALDAANLDELKALLPADGWFRASRDGRQTTQDAWLIIQHGKDYAFMAQVLERMEPLAAAGEVDGHDYALLYDRMEMFNGRPQRFGSQMTCTGQAWMMWPSEDPARIDERRQAIHWSEPYAQTVARLNPGRPCSRTFTPPLVKSEP